MNPYDAIGIGPSHLARAWAGFSAGPGIAYGGNAGGPERASCGLYCSALDSLSLQVFEEDTTAQLQQQGYQGAELMGKVKARVAEIHTKRVAMNKASWEQHEVPRTPENTVVYEARLDERDGKNHLYHSEAQQFVHDMFRNSQRVAQRAEQEFGITGLYNRQEHEAFLRIEHALLSGRAAAGMWVAYDPSGTVRYVSQIENRNGTYATKWLDVGLIGGDLTPTEGLSLLDRISENTRDSVLVVNSESAPYLLLRQEVVPSREVWERMKTLIDERRSVNSTNASQSDTRTVDKRDEQPVFIQNVRIDDPYGNASSEGADEYVRNRDIAQEINKRIHSGVAAMGALKIAEVMHTKISDEGSKFHGFSLVELIDRHVTQRILHTTDTLLVGNSAFVGEQIAEKDTALTGSHHSESGSDTKKKDKRREGKTVVAGHRLEKEQVGEIKAVEKSRRRHEEKTLRTKHKEIKRKHQEDRIGFLKEKSGDTEGVVFLKTRKKEKRRRGQEKRRSGEQILEKRLSERVKPEKTTKKTAAAEKLTLFVREKMKEKKMRSKRVIKKDRKERKRLRLERRAVHLVEVPIRIGQVLKKEKKSLIQGLAPQGESLRNKEKQGAVSTRRGLEARKKLTVQFLFAWILYRFLNTERNFIRPPLVLLRQSADQDKRQGVALKKQGNGEHRNDGLPKHTETPWILLSIIWYLTMIREAGKQSSNQQAAQSSHQQLPRFFTPVFPIDQHGVIFAFSS